MTRNNKLNANIKLDGGWPSSLAEIIVFDLIIEPGMSLAGLRVDFHRFGSFLKNWLSRCKSAQWENRTIPVLSSGTLQQDYTPTREPSLFQGHTWTFPAPDLR